MRGIITAAGYVPYHRLRRAEISEFLGSGGGKGTRSVAGHDEDTTTMGVEAARYALRSRPGVLPSAIWFCTSAPAYLDKTNATAVHAALRLPAEVPALDFGGALRSGMGALSAALHGGSRVLVVLSDRRDGLPTSADETNGGDGAAALLVGEQEAGAPVLAELVASASATTEMVDRWRTPGDQRSKVWEERFGEGRYLALAQDAFGRALKLAGIEPAAVDVLALSGMHARAVRSASGKLGVSADGVADDLSRSVGQTGTAHPGLLLASVLEKEAAGQAGGALGPGRILALVNLADGADVVLLRTTAALADWQPFRPVATQASEGAGGVVGYAKFLSWRGMLQPEPPRRPEPSRVSTPAAWRNEDWKFGFTGSKDHGTGAVHLPPARVSRVGGAIDDMEPVEMAERRGTVVTFTIDRLAYSPSPPIVFAVVDFDGGGRFPVELTDLDADRLAIGDRVEMTFRRLFTADGIHDYFWKARPVPDGPGDGADGSAHTGRGRTD